MKGSAFKRTLFVVLSGGVLIQFGSCATLIAPLALGLAENFLLSALLGGVFGG